MSLLVDPENDERRSSNACRYAAVEKEKLQAMPKRAAAQVSRTPDHPRKRRQQRQLRRTRSQLVEFNELFIVFFETFADSTDSGKG